jgi:acyl dehydratase
VTVARSDTDTGTESWRFDLADLIRYSGAALDFNTIHHDPQAAHDAGFETVVAHGMLTLGRVLARTADEVGPGGVAACRARFRAPVHLGAEVSATTTSGPGDTLTITVTSGDQTALTAEVELGEPDPGGFEVPTGEPVADHRLLVERGALTRLAVAVGARARFWYDAHAAADLGFPAVPAVPTCAFALPALGWYPDEQQRPGARRPDPVADCALWSQSVGPVVHAGQSFTYRRPLLAGETVRSRQWITGRRTKQGSRGELRLTDVTQLLSGASGEAILSATATLLATGPAVVPA